MPRRKKCRMMHCRHEAQYFKPRGIPMHELEECVITFDEVEAIRLADFEGKTQEQAAELMGVSRPTFGRIVANAHRVIADALVHGKALRMTGAEYAVLREEPQPCCRENP